MINHFEESEMPYGTLERFGLTQEMVEDLPYDALQNIYNGRRSPVLPITVTTEDGETETARTRFSLVRTPEGGVDVLFYPKLDECDLNLFNEQQKQRLLEGKAIIGYLESNEENRPRKQAGSLCTYARYRSQHAVCVRPLSPNRSRDAETPER